MIQDITVSQLYNFAIAHSCLNVSAIVVLEKMEEDTKKSSPLPNTTLGFTFKEYTTQDLLVLFSTQY